MAAAAAGWLAEQQVTKEDFPIPGVAELLQKNIEHVGMPNFKANIDTAHVRFPTGPDVT